MILNTIPHYIKNNATKYANDIAIREKSLVFGKLKIGKNVSMRFKILLWDFIQRGLLKKLLLQ